MASMAALLTVRPFCRADQAQAQAIYSKTWSGMRFSHVSEAVFSFGGLVLLTAATIAADLVLVAAIRAWNLNAGSLVCLRCCAPVLGGLPVVLVLTCYSQLCTWMFIDESMALGVGSLHAHCSSSESSSDPELAVRRKCWVVESKAANEDAEQRLIGFIVVRTSTADAEEQWLCPGNRKCDYSGQRHGLAVVEWLVVDEDFQRKGAARMMLKTAEAHCRSLPDRLGRNFYGHLRLVVSSCSVDAILFYKQMGFVTEKASSCSWFGSQEFHIAKYLDQDEQK
mmetsp:Transcript_36728/g.59207  ORF Transcript_36728/g.59207 Transcript_36728/m.59207 type:complete len:281 (+) Transcript_36728:113-955(+)